MAWFCSTIPCKEGFLVPNIHGLLLEMAAFLLSCIILKELQGAGNKAK